MKSLITTLLVLACANVLAAEQPDNGFYLRAKGEPAPWIKCHDGGKVFLGAGKSLEVEQSWLSSQNNENSRFYLSVTIPYDAEVGPSTYILIVDGKVYKQTGSGASHEKTSSLNFYILGKENAEQVSRYMKTPVVNRRHPRHNLSVSFIPTKSEFSVGDDVTATLRIVNVGTNPVAFMKGGRNRATRDNQYVFSARQRGKQIKDMGTSDHFGGIAVRRVLKPGEVFEDKISLSKWFAFDKAGIYQIHGSYYLDFNDPAAKSYKTIWEDYVSADFTVRIKEQKKTPNKEPKATGSPAP